jgi:hypothetical protein
VSLGSLSVLATVVQAVVEQTVANPLRGRREPAILESASAYSGKPLWDPVSVLAARARKKALFLNPHAISFGFA